MVPVPHTYFEAMIAAVLLSGSEGRVAWGGQLGLSGSPHAQLDILDSVTVLDAGEHWVVQNDLRVRA